jgi:hypothetical protein
MTPTFWKNTMTLMLISLMRVPEVAFGIIVKITGGITSMKNPPPNKAGKTPDKEVGYLSVLRHILHWAYRSQV